MVGTDNLAMNEINALKKELEEKDKNLILAAQYGKELLDQNSELHTKMEKLVQEHNRKIEELEQERYSISMKLETKDRTVNSLTNELDSQERHHKENIRKLKEEMEEERWKLNRKISSYESNVEALENEVLFLKDKSEDMQKLLEQFQQEQHEISRLDVSNSLEEHTAQLQFQVNSLLTEKQDLEKEVLDLKSLVKSSSLHQKKRDDEIKRLQTELEQKECQLTSMYNEIQRAKTENEELRMEIDQMKFDETDTKKKGNSLFAELEDNRQALEKHVISLNSTLSTLRKQCEIKSQQVGKLKLQVASLLNMTSCAADLQYQKQLEDTLGRTRTELSAATNRCKELEDEVKRLENLKQVGGQKGETQTSGNYIKYLYEESQNKVKSLEEELRAMCFTKILLSDENLQLKRKLHQSEKNREASYSEVVRLNVRIEEFMAAEGIPAGTDNESPNEKLEYYYEKLPDLKTKYLEESREKLKEPLNEIVIKTEVKSPKQAVIVDKDCKQKLTAHEEDKENRLIKDKMEKHKGIKKERKAVAFLVEENEMQNESKKPQKGEKVSKPLRRMEAPIIRENTDAQSTECKVQ